MSVEDYRRFVELINLWKAQVEAERARGMDADLPPATRGYAYGVGDGLNNAAAALSELLDEMAQQAMEPAQHVARLR